VRIGLHVEIARRGNTPEMRSNVSAVQEGSMHPLHKMVAACYVMRVIILTMALVLPPAPVAMLESTVMILQ
jgi:hypothetical protein